MTATRVQELISEELGIDYREISLSSSLASLGASSLDMAAFVLELENEFGIEIPHDDSDKFVTVGEVVKYVDQRRAAL